MPNTPSPCSVCRLAIDQAREYGLLGKNIFDYRLLILISTSDLGAGAFVCGEETALLTSIEGNRGEPRPRPPFPAVKGLFGEPTVLNNVETYANIPQIILKGADWFRSLSVLKRATGTKVFALGGKITHHRPGGSSHGHHPAGSGGGNRRRRARRPSPLRLPRPAAPPAAASLPELTRIPPSTMTT